MRHDDIWHGFADAIVRIGMPEGTHRLEPRPRGDVGEFPFDAPVHIITAHNPAGEHADPADNERRHDELTRLLDGHRTLATVGSAPDGTMAEPGYAILDIDPVEAHGHARRFGQLAIYRWTVEALTIIGIDEPRRHEAGWALVDDRMAVEKWVPISEG